MRNPKAVISSALICLVALGIGLFIYAVQSRITRLPIILIALSVGIGSVILSWQWKGARYTLLVIIALCSLTLLLPGRSYSRDGLQEAYVAALQKYQGVPYVWGGETELGIDCSGLVRLGLIRAGLQQGIRTLNPRLIRNGLRLWWDDCSADALMKEHHGQTRHLFKAQSINAITPDQLQAGDIAVTADGIHVLGYLGRSTWIEADPGAKKVLVVQPPCNNNWFNVPVCVMRWRQLE